MPRRRRVLAAVPVVGGIVAIVACSSSTFSGGSTSGSDAGGDEASLNDTTASFDDAGSDADARSLLPECPPPAGPAGVDTLGAYDSASGNFTWSNCFSANLDGGGHVFVNLYPLAFAGAWEGDGVDEPGDYDPATAMFHLVRSADAGGDLDVGFGGGGENTLPVGGDWNGDGYDSIGFYHVPSSTFFLNDTNTSGTATYTVTFGSPKDGGANLVPIVGDWDGDGDDTVGLYDPDLGKFYLRNALLGGGADVSFVLGSPHSIPLAGDWDGDGRSGVGVYDPVTGVVELENIAGTANPDYRFTIDPGLNPVTGDWDGK